MSAQFNHPASTSNLHLSRPWVWTTYQLLWRRLHTHWPPHPISLLQFIGAAPMVAVITLSRSSQLHAHQSAAPLSRRAAYRTRQPGLQGQTLAWLAVDCFKQTGHLQAPKTSFDHLDNIGSIQASIITGKIRPAIGLLLQAPPPPPPLPLPGRISSWSESNRNRFWRGA